ncbi:MAG: leucyl aminopeptidase [Cryomorphaceae bacterium]|nr:leucyl aminopeptidase [Cryomorphaceae bacterium]
MKTLIKKKTTISNQDNLILLCDLKSKLSDFPLSKQELDYIKKEQKDKKEIVAINQYGRHIFVILPKQEKDANKNAENCRMLGDSLAGTLKDESAALIIDLKENQTEAMQIAEGIALSNYTFTKHKTDPKPNKLETIYLCKNSNQKDIAELQNIIDAVYFTRDLINEPFSHLTAKDLANAAVKSAKKYGIKTTVLNKKKIEALKMGGLLAVNKGSIDEPTFTIMEWKPKNAKNKKPIVLIGKGIVFDTGGLSLKPTHNSMDLMKIDMGGAGTVIGAMQAIAANKLPIYVIALTPATDNRPSGNAYAPGDVITMHDGTTVEVLNTDAEGRLILGDALSFAKKYKPELVIDLATLTGAAVAAIGHYGIVSMHEGAEKEHTRLKETGDYMHERLAEMPFWSDYDELIKSDIADIKNLGGPHAGAITAGKFLAHFADYPWIHLDIAGPTYTQTKYGYRGKGATGMGVRLLYQFIKNRA